MNIKVAIIEDEESAANRMKKELNRLVGVTFDILVVLDSIEAVCNWLDTKPAIDLIFMDIQLSDGISFEIFHRTTLTCPIIFTTAYDEYALQAFKVNSIDYLLKPIDPEELKNAIDQYIAQSNPAPPKPDLSQLLQLAEQLQPKAYRTNFLVSFKQKMVLIDVQEVAYLYVKERGVFLRKKDGKEYVLDFFLDELETQLDPTKFYRANRQFFVSKSAIVEIEPYFTGRLILKVVPEPPSPIIISRAKVSDFKKWADS